MKRLQQTLLAVKSYKQIPSSKSDLLVACPSLGNENHFQRSSPGESEQNHGCLRHLSDITNEVLP